MSISGEYPGTLSLLRSAGDCGHWIEGDEPQVNAEYGRQLIENGLAEEVAAPTTKKAGMPAPTGKATA